jgi:hypothetical protein
MASTTSKVLAGCGVGCLLLMILVAGMGFMGYRWAQDAVEAVEEAGRIEQELDERFGRARSFVPALAPGIPSDRLETFVGIREGLAAPRQELAGAINGLKSVGETGGGIAAGFKAARAGVGMAPATLEFSRARNQALLDNGMGLGEYTWIYWYTFNAWLGHPADDSELHEFMQEREAGSGRVEIHMDGGMEPERITWRLRRDIRSMLRNLEQGLLDSPEHADLAALVSSELAMLDEDPGRVPWEDGLPAELAVGLEPFRERLEATYSKAVNPFELIEFD